jgi:hypothetical protein
VMAWNSFKTRINLKVILLRSARMIYRVAV